MQRAPLFVTIAGGAAAALALGFGCSSSSSATSDDGGSDAGACTPIDSACGQPCEDGNALGIGRFCNGITDCVGTPIPTLCATLGDPRQHFCTAHCMLPDAAVPEGGAMFPTDCGEGASCQCQGDQCGCMPNQCL